MTKISAGIYETEQGGTRVTITDVTAHSGRLDAWIEVHRNGRRLTFGDYNLRGGRTVSTLARDCAEAAPSAKMPWREWLGEAVYEAVHDSLEGEQPHRLCIADARPPGWIVQNLVGDDQASSIVGFGETGKSMLGLAVGCTVSSGKSAWLGLEPKTEGPVLTLDWEATAQPHEWRLAQLCRGTGQPEPPHLWHRHETLPLARIITPVAKHAARIGARLIIVDSVMLARGASDTYGHEGSINLYSALARLEVPCLLIDHRAKPPKDPKQNNDQGPWGSIINFNSTRIIWACSANPGPHGFDMTLKRLKANYHGGLRDHEWRLRFSDDNRSARFEWVSAGTLMAGGEATITDKILGLLQRSGEAGQTVKGIAAELGVGDATIRARLSELRRQGRADQVGGMWLADDRQQEAPF